MYIVSFNLESTW